MSNLKDISGHRFGRLVVLERAGRTTNGNVTWLCKCDCGNLRVVDGYLLRKGQTSSCGCLRQENSSESIKHNPETSKYIGNWHVLEKTWHPTTDELRVNNSSGITGVSFDRRQKRWVARLYFNGKYVLNSSFELKENAISARKNAESIYLSEVVAK